MRDPHYGRKSFKSVITLGALHSKLWKRPRPPASASSATKNVELLGLYPIQNYEQVNIRNDRYCVATYFISKHPVIFIRPLGSEKVYLPLYKVANTPFHIQGDILSLC